MSRIHGFLRRLAALSAAGAGLGAASAGCFVQSEDCKLTLTCEAGGAAGQAGSGGSGGTAGAEPTNCGDDPSDPASIANECGVFVNGSVNKAGAAGTREDPVGSLAEAAALLGSTPGARRIFACSGTIIETDTVKLSTTRLIGGFEKCTEGEWSWTGKNTELNGPADKPAILFSGGKNGLDHVDVTVPDATAKGASSIALIVDGGSLELRELSLKAGRGADGANGDDPSGSGISGMPGGNGADGCDNDQGEFGGPGGENVCAGIDTSGGAGGNGHTGASGNDGSDGKPVGAVGKGGIGISGGVLCSTGGMGGGGISGTPGMAGLGATQAALPGTLSPEGFLPALAPDGKEGFPGQGGGGGGGAFECSLNAGPSGGGGGAGGCGGMGGKGGHGGGSSIGIVSLGATLTFAAVQIATSNGGKGGDGANGQAGGMGGMGGSPGSGSAGSYACGGGKGGDGGMGGMGGGGLGGHSIGIAFTNAAPSMTGATVTLADAGMGGMGDDAVAKTAGESGITALAQEF